MNSIAYVKPLCATLFPRLDSGVYRLALGNGSSHIVFLLREGPGLNPKQIAIGIEGLGSHRFAPNVQFEPHNIREYLGLSKGDSCNFADFLDCQLGSLTRNYGTYSENVPSYAPEQLRIGATALIATWSSTTNPLTAKDLILYRTKVTHIHEGAGAFRVDTEHPPFVEGFNELPNGWQVHDWFESRSGQRADNLVYNGQAFTNSDDDTPAPRFARVLGLTPPSAPEEVMPIAPTPVRIVVPMDKVTTALQLANQPGMMSAALAELDNLVREEGQNATATLPEGSMITFEVQLPPPGVPNRNGDALSEEALEQVKNHLAVHGLSAARP